MGTQTLEILRTGVWASLTGGWFYDPHQSVFCNTFHFYLWIFLLCFPFILYLFFPQTVLVYSFYCGTVGFVFLTLKIANHGLHRMFDTSECIHESLPEEELPESQRKRLVALPVAKAILEEEGIELQVLKPTDLRNASIHDPTDDDSLNSVETATRPISSTIDLKVDVHRKNSSESSEEAKASAECCAGASASGVKPSSSGIGEADESPVSECALSRAIDDPVLHSSCEPEKVRSKPKETRHRNRVGLTWNHGIDFDPDQAELTIGANGSCGVLPRQPRVAPVPDHMKNTGSLELPIKDSDSSSTSEKGLLYWKQQNLESSSCCDKLRKVENVKLRSSGELAICSETSIASITSIPELRRAEESAIALEPCEELGSERDAAANKRLEEEFDWFAGEYGDHLPSSSESRLPKFKSDDNIRENQTMPCLKFQANSDEDSSDNAGSRSPLLCRHESLEKSRYSFQDGAKSMRTAADEKTTKSCPTVVKTPLAIYYDDIKSVPEDLPRWNDRKKSSKRESFLHGNKKLSLPQRSAAEEADIAPATPLSRDRRTDLTTWSSERVGLDWLFEHTDSETDVAAACLWKYTLSEDSDSASVERKGSEVPTATASSSGNLASSNPPESLGAIPKTQVVKRPHRGHRGRSKRSGQSVDINEHERREKKKQKNERENGIIDEEEVDSSAVWVETHLDEEGSSSKPVDWRETYDSSSGSANELSSLLPLSSLLSSLHPPSSPLLAAFLASRRDLPAAPMPAIDDGGMSMVTPQGGAPRLEGVRERHRRAKRDRCQRRSTRSVVAHTPVSNPNTHIATSYNDTTQGAVHCFQDERGNWWSYTFGDSTAGPSQPVPADGPPRSRKAPGRKMSEAWDSNINLVSNSNSENESSMSVSPRMPRIVMNMRRSSGNPSVSTNSSSVLLSIGDSNNNGGLDNQRSQLQLLTENMTRVRGLPTSCLQTSESEETNRFPFFPFLQPPSVARKHYYKLHYTPWHYLKVRFDRLELIALLDRNLTHFENCLSLFLSVLVSICGILLLSYGFYRDLFAFLLCVTIAGCQYSLLKSVQPDASSPTHGYNRVIIYSRAIYFCVVAVVMLGLSECLKSDYEPLVLYNMTVTSPSVLRTFRDLLSVMLLFFPILFTLGLFPQINTFALYCLEQLDIHLFGGNASCSLIGSIYCVVRSILSVFIIFGFAYAALCEEKQSRHILFSFFCTLVVTWSYHLSRASSDPTILWNIVKDECRDKPSHVSSGESSAKEGEDGGKEEFVDPLPGKLKQTVHARMINDVIVCGFVAPLVFGIHCSGVFNTLQPDLNKILWIICGCSGFFLHYLVPHMRKQLPWLCLARPILRSHENGLFEALAAAKVMWFEETSVVLCFLERNVLYPVLALSALSNDAPQLAAKFGPITAALLLTICGMKMLRSAFSHTPHQYLIVVFAALVFEMDYRSYSETFIVDYFFISIAFSKAYEFLLKVQFVVTYIAPWQITWGSAFHAFAQPFSVPHSAMLFVQAAISAILSAPLNPFLGSAIFLVSYVRPVKFWERDYNTKRVDQSNIRLSSHLDRNLGADDNNLNSIFYEHLTRSLQHSLCGDLQLGRWGPVSQGDCFVLASDYLNCLVHIIEMGNGLVTFQMRGLEFRGTYCQQREVEAISEGVQENDGCCCCEPGHLPYTLSVNAAFSQRWLAWEVTATEYVLEGYSISDNSAVSMLQVFDFRKVIVTYYVKCIIWYCVRSPRLDDWLSSQTILGALQAVSERSFVDLDPVFNVNIDQDFDFRAEGITRSSFCAVYFDWVQYCASKLEKAVDKSRDSPLVSLCLALSLMARRALGTASHNTVSSVEFFLYGLHTLFKGDFRITSVRDEWVFSDMDLLKKVVAPAVRMSLKLHQDHFMSPDEYEEKDALYSAIAEHDANLVISHEADPAWRGAVLSGTPSLLALRHVMDDGTDEYKVIMLNKRYLMFRVIKLNRECVRGLWAGQQQELIFLRNRNPERGSIQNAKQALRNMINSSCDQPIGYPIYVSPLTTSYADSNEQVCGIIGGSLSLQSMRDTVFGIWKKIRERCRQGCSSGGSVARGDDPNFSFGHEGVYAMTHITHHSGYGHSTSGSQSMDSSQMQLGGSHRGGSLGRSSLSGRSSFPTGGKPSSATLASLAGLLSSAELAKGECFLRERETSFTSIRERQSREDCCRRYDEKRPERSDDRRERSEEKRERSEEKERRRERRVEPDEIFLQFVRIVDPKQVYDAINLGRRIDVLWPDENMRARGGRSSWKDWLPDAGMDGLVVHRWVPNHREPGRRSHVDKTILLLKIGERFVPIAESGVVEIQPDPDQAAKICAC